jgi:hypothetical protein
MPGILRSAVGGMVVTVAALLLVVGSASADQLSRTVARVEAPRAQLERARTVAVPGGGQIRRYKQQVGGLPVLGAEAVVVVPTGAAPILVSDNTRAGIDPQDRSGALQRSAAIAAARSATGASKLRGPASARLGLDPATGKLVWEVSLPSGEPLADLLVTVDARSGEKLRSKDLLRHATGTATGSAMIFNPNPVVEQGGYSGLKDRNDKDSALLTSLRLPVTLERLIDSAKGCLKGTYVDARVGEDGKKVCSPGFDFTDLTRSDDEFEAVMAYFHVDRERAYADSLGLSQPLRQKAQKVLVDAIADDNSFYSSQTQLLVLGSGGVDDAEDADVINHEFGHSLQDQAAPHSLQNLQGGTIGEGFGDYMAAVMSDLTTGPSPFDTCIFDWDGISYSNTGCGRDADITDNVKTAEHKCPGHKEDIHCVGQVWSSSLFSLRQALGLDTNGQSIMDRDVLEANFTNSKSTSYESFAAGILAADQLFYAGAHIPALEAEFVARKFCKSSGC